MNREEILKEKERLEKQLEELDKKLRPSIIEAENRNYDGLIELLEEVIDDYDQDGRSGNDEYKVYEHVMELFYGKDIWDWINWKMDE